MEVTHASSVSTRCSGTFLPWRHHVLAEELTDTVAFPYVCSYAVRCSPAEGLGCVHHVERTVVRKARFWARHRLPQETSLVNRQVHPPTAVECACCGFETSFFGRHHTSEHRATGIGSLCIITGDSAITRSSQPTSWRGGKQPRVSSSEGMPHVRGGTAVCGQFRFPEQIECPVWDDHTKRLPMN